jgi:hypothetical protein
MADPGILILNDPIQIEAGPVLIIPIFQESNEAPWGGTLKWAHERPTCRHVQDFLEKGTQAPWDTYPAYADRMCKAASLGGPLACLFHEEADLEA